MPFAYDSAIGARLPRRVLMDREQRRRAAALD